MISDLAGTDIIEFIIWILLEGFGSVAGGGGGRHICLVRDSNPTDVTVRYQNIP